MRYQHFCINVLQSLHSVSIRDLAAPALTFSRHPASVHTHEHPARKTPQLALGGWNRQEQAYKPRQGHQSFLGGASSFAFGFKILSCEFVVARAIVSVWLRFGGVGVQNNESHARAEVR